MSLMLTCEETAATLSDYLDGVLPLGKLLQVKVHLYRCPACRALLATLRALPELMAQAAQVPEPIPAEAQAALQGALARLGQPRPWPATPVPAAAREVLAGEPDQPMRLLAAAHAQVARQRRPRATSDRLPAEVLAQVPPEAQWRWQDAGAGVRKAELLTDTAGHRLVLVHAQPGARIAAHRHLGSESILVLEGAMVDAGRTYAAGAWLHHGMGSSHAPRVLESGCWALVREEGREAWPGPLAWLRQLSAAS
jgi:predicted ChrR family anti-sigma factor